MDSIAKAYLNLFAAVNECVTAANARWASCDPTDPALCRKLQTKSRKLLDAVIVTLSSMLTLFGLPIAFAIAYLVKIRKSVAILQVAPNAQIARERIIAACGDRCGWIVRVFCLTVFEVQRRLDSESRFRLLADTVQQAFYDVGAIRFNTLPEPVRVGSRMVSTFPEAMCAVIEAQNSFTPGFDHSSSGGIFGAFCFTKDPREFGKHLIYVIDSMEKHLTEKSRSNDIIKRKVSATPIAELFYVTSDEDLERQRIATVRSRLESEAPKCSADTSLLSSSSDQPTDDNLRQKINSSLIHVLDNAHHIIMVEALSANLDRAIISARLGRRPYIPYHTTKVAEEPCVASLIEELELAKAACEGLVEKFTANPTVELPGSSECFDEEKFLAQLKQLILQA
jgi:hypothetical protein